MTTLWTYVQNDKLRSNESKLSNATLQTQMANYTAIKLDQQQEQQATQ